MEQLTAGTNPTQVTETLQKTFNSWKDYAKSGNWMKIIGAVAIFVVILVVIGKLLGWWSDDEADEEKSEYREAIESGIKDAIKICGIPAVLERVFSPEIEGTTGEVGKYAHNVGNFFYRTCSWLIQNFHIVMMVMNLYFQYVMFEYCIQSVEERIEMSSQYTSSTVSGEISQAYSTMNTANEMMQCFGMLNQMTYTAMDMMNMLRFSGGSLFGPGSLEVSQNGHRLGDGETIQGDKLLHVKASFCGGGRSSFDIVISANVGGAPKECDSWTQPCYYQGGSYTRPYYQQQYQSNYQYVYNTQNIPYGGSYGYQSYPNYGAGNVLQKSYRISDCDENGEGITKVWVEAPEKSMEFNCENCGGTGGAQQQPQGLKLGEVCEDTSKCKEGVCCYNSIPDLSDGSKKCTRFETSCKCKKNGGTGSCSTSKGENCVDDTRGVCPTGYSYCC